MPRGQCPPLAAELLSECSDISDISPLLPPSRAVKRNGLLALRTWTQPVDSCGLQAWVQVIRISVVETESGRASAHSHLE